MFCSDNQPKTSNYNVVTDTGHYKNYAAQY